MTMEDFGRSREDGTVVIAQYLAAYAAAHVGEPQPRMAHTVLGFHRRFGFETVETFTREQVVAMTDALVPVAEVEEGFAPFP